MCEYWSEIEDGSGQSFEYCKKTGRAVSCSGVRDECNNGQYMDHIPYTEGDI